MNQDKLKALEEIEQEAPSSLQFTEWLIAGSCIPRREIMQAYMVWKFKYNWGMKEDTEAWLRWAERGYAKVFDKNYHPEICARELYFKIKGEMRE
jgi:hypothetical protein